MDGHWVLSPGWSFSSKFGETPTRDLKVLSVMQVCQFLTTNSSLITAIERWQNTEKKNIFWIPFFLFAFVRLVIPFPSKEKRPPQIATSVRRPVCMNLYRYLGPTVSSMSAYCYSDHLSFQWQGKSNVPALLFARPSSSCFAQTISRALSIILKHLILMASCSNVTKSL